MTAPPGGPVRIHALDATLANQIAAGEVVERPASVLKELLENSLDAGSTRVRVEASGGGAALLRVSDDGAGIHVQDLALALERHATSKIATLDELESVRSMGFRGEALPSIASVSRLRIESRAEGADSAWCVSAEGGPVDLPPAPAAHPRGTTVTVRDLFFNTPVRRRFLRTPRTELRHLDRVFRRLALSAFPVAMTLEHDGRELLRAPAAGDAAARRRRVARLLGAAFADAALEVDRSAAGMRLWGWLGAPAGARERGDLQHLFVNARPVTDPTVRHAVRVGYGELLADAAQPAWLLYLELDPREVDVNVHPAKNEVRFREARMVHDFVRATVRGALGGPEVAPGPAAPVRGSAEARDRHAPVRHPGATPPDGDAPVLLAVLADGLVVASLGGRVLLARGAELRRSHLCRELERAAGGGTCPVSRPLLLPERLRPGAGEAALDAGVEALTALGFELRRSGPDTVLLLAVPEPLARVPAADIAAALAGGWRHRARARDWVPVLAALAAGATGCDAEEARVLLAALHGGGGDGPWLVVDAQTLETLLTVAGREP